MSWPPGRDSSTAGWAASGSSSSHHYVTEVRGSLYRLLLCWPQPLTPLLLVVLHKLLFNVNCVQNQIMTMWQQQMCQLIMCVCVYLCTLLHRECVSVIRRAVHSSLLFSLWEFCPSERPDRSTLHVTYLLPAWCTGPWCHFPSPADAHRALSGHL